MSVYTHFMCADLQDDTLISALGVNGMTAILDEDDALVFGGWRKENGDMSGMCNLYFVCTNKIDLSSGKNLKILEGKGLVGS